MSKLHNPMTTIGEAQAIIDCVIDAIGADRIPGVRADIPAALVVASRLLQQANTALDTISIECRV